MDQPAIEDPDRLKISIPCATSGSSTDHFRRVEQPYIDNIYLNRLASATEK